MPIDQPSPLVRSRQRVSDHGEVFTPEWMVGDMLDQVKDESERIESRFLEPACGSGNFLVPVLRRKLAVVRARYAKSEFELGHQALLAVMSIYGIELLADNVAECRARLVSEFAGFLHVDDSNDWHRAGTAVLKANVILGDAMKMATPGDQMIEFPEWAYLGRGKYQRRDFRLDSLAQRSSVQGTLFEGLEEHEVFIPTRTYPPMSVHEIAS